MADFPETPKEQAKDEFWAYRGHAIGAYSHLEYCLCDVFSTLSETSKEVASIIFYKIVNAGTLYGILEKLLRRKYGTTYSLFWNSCLKFLRNDISEMRNRIVHWDAWSETSEGKTVTVLRPHGFGYNVDPDNPPPITTDDLVAFVEKCGFFGRLLTIFHLLITPDCRVDLDTRFPGQSQTWNDIFLQPIVYPPPSNHPLCPKPSVPGSPSPPSPA